MSIRILTGDVRAMLATLPDESVHCVVTSPPYWALRDYGVAGQLGMEPTMGEHIETMVDVFREVRRVLRKDGTVFLNYGDCYNAAGRVGHGTQVGLKQRTNRASANGLDENRPSDPNLKPKDLCMVPNRLAIALQDDGWWVRSEIIWHKPNPMPESVTDRPASAHEKVWLLSKSARYFYDSEAVKVPAKWPDGPNAPDKIKSPHGQGFTRRAKEWPGSWGRAKQASPTDQRSGNYKAPVDQTTANLRNVWTIPTKGFSGAHFATFPPALVEPCIKAGTSEKGCCAGCGAPWVREVDATKPDRASREPRAKAITSPRQDGNSWNENDGRGFIPVETTTTGWSPSCACDVHPIIPCTVVDPFIGSGTTAMVADRLGRDCIGIELNPANVEMARDRLQDDAGMFAEVAAQ